MDNSTNVTVVVYFNGSVITNTKHDMILIFDKLVYFFIPQTMSFEKLKLGLCQGINIGIQKRVVRIRYRRPISNLNNNIQF